MDDSFQNGLVALAGGGQTGATLIGARASGAPTVVRFTTVATTADSALLPPASAGLRYTVLNAGAASMTVYPSLGDAINAGAANAGLAVANAKAATFFCAVNGTWNAILSA